MLPRRGRPLLLMFVMDRLLKNMLMEYCNDLKHQLDIDGKSGKYCREKWKMLMKAFEDPKSPTRCKAREGHPSLLFTHKMDIRKLSLDRLDHYHHHHHHHHHHDQHRCHRRRHYHRCHHHYQASNDSNSEQHPFLMWSGLPLQDWDGWSPFHHIHPCDHHFQNHHFKTGILTI